ncbi:MAG TPA: DUF4188 domain-containing protein [Blastocatellia bacterium]|nr:DUF4188 domain-containing protein [Blastocatellia bacterium]HMV83239.1 DUF4188 domain-containing protein [Blastocatellia bacterium]HMX25296.1 DUF4188 domain-containing protein [Blastocatellia bacterium]HMY76398.1 DUF4188 domain-containing protein [Blastocatellia bacterium]HMZ23186.1 DUF4188 domain-containing protein [Blastocatellia bacterium]
MKTKVDRRTVDLSTYPDLVVIYLGMRVNSLRGLLTVARLGPLIQKAVDEKPDGLLVHEQIIYGLFPPHIGMRQYWRDFDSLEKWSRQMPHQKWWQEFLRDSGGTGFWHETYFMRGGMEAIFDDIKVPFGLTQFAAPQPARGPMFSSRKRLMNEDARTASVINEEELY